MVVKEEKKGRFGVKKHGGLQIPITGEEKEAQEGKTPEHLTR